MQVFVGNDSGENGVAGAASVWAAATGDRDEAHVANSVIDMTSAGCIKPTSTSERTVTE